MTRLVAHLGTARFCSSPSRRQVPPRHSHRCEAHCMIRYPELCPPYPHDITGCRPPCRACSPARRRQNVGSCKVHRVRIDRVAAPYRLTHKVPANISEGRRRTALEERGWTPLPVRHDLLQCSDVSPCLCQDVMQIVADTDQTEALFAELCHSIRTK